MHEWAMRTGAALAALLLSGCGAQLADGTWTGRIQTTSSALLEDRSGGVGTEADYAMTFTLCAGRAQIHLLGEDENTSVIRLDQSDARSGHQVHYAIKQSADTDPDWVETQVVSVADAGADVLLVDWRRIVTNPPLPDDDDFRSFTQGGSARLAKVSDECSAK